MPRNLSQRSRRSESGSPSIWKSEISLTGQVTSGKGRLTFKGGTAADGQLRIKMSGKNFLAADIPAARVTISPELELTRDTQRMDLAGTVQVPQAAIDLTKLPEGRGGQSLSPKPLCDPAGGVTGRRRSRCL